MSFSICRKVRKNHILYIGRCRNVLGVVAKLSKVMIVAWPLMVSSTLALDTYELRFLSWVCHVIFPFVHFISLDTLGGLRAFRKPSSI